jgi:CarD family transcriptional regulator
MSNRKEMTETLFNVGDYVVYPAHGVGKLLAIETHDIAGHKVELFVITFDKDRMTLRLPIQKAKNAGLRPISSKDEFETVLQILTVKSKPRRLMWSRRAQEYENKINSGNPVSIAEVVRDLFRNHSDADQSYSERQIYQAAIDRLARELAAIEAIGETDAISKMETIMRAA